MRTQSRTMPFTEEQMQQIYNTNLIDFAVRHGFEIEKGRQEYRPCKTQRRFVLIQARAGVYLFLERGF